MAFAISKFMALFGIMGLAAMNLAVVNGTLPVPVNIAPFFAMNFLIGGSLFYGLFSGTGQETLERLSVAIAALGGAWIGITAITA